jgi:hypothetical protein
MRTSFFSALALPAFFLNALAAPAAVDATIEKRQLADATSIVSQLYTNIQTYTGAINATAAGISSNSTALQNATAAASFITNVNAITALVTAATAETDLLAPVSGLVRRQTDTALAGLVENILLEVSGMLGTVVATLGHD